MTFELGYRPPFSWSGVLDFLAHRRIDGVEHVGNDTYARTIALQQRGHSHGWVSVTHAPNRHSINVTVPASVTSGIAQILGRIRRVFDLGCRPDLIDSHLGGLAAELPGMRVPGAFDGFEIAVRAIVGQQISVANARNVLARMAGRFGTPVKGAPFGLVNVFPPVDVFAVLAADVLQETGITRTRAEAVIAVAKEVLAGRIVLEPLAPLDDTLAALRCIRGIGEWTVQYIAMRSLGWPNAFPQDDAVLKKQLGFAKGSSLRQHAGRWEPWRAYAAMHVWRQYAAGRANRSFYPL